eukprot:11739289-Alexandrium_andersonii.AAC.1
MTLADVLSLRRSTTWKSLAQSTMFRHQYLDRARSATWIKSMPTTSLKCRGLGRAAARRGFGRAIASRCGQRKSFATRTVSAGAPAMASARASIRGGRWPVCSWSFRICFQSSGATGFAEPVLRRAASSSESAAESSFISTESSSSSPSAGKASLVWAS